MYPPTLWGPALWQTLFACAWHCADVAAMRRLLFEQIPLLLPCAKCRDHFARKCAVVTRRVKGEPQTAEALFKWLYHIKDEVNKTLHRPSLALQEVTDRYVFHHGAVDDVALGDALVLMALGARETQRDDLFVECCHTLAHVLPLPDDSQLRRALADTRKPIVPHAVRVAHAARVERGIGVLTQAHYRAFRSEPEEAPRTQASKKHQARTADSPRRRLFA